MLKLALGWYILMYHDISWEDSSYTSSLGTTFPPDVFEEHVRGAASVASILSVQDAYEEWRKGLSRPVVSFWFDDGCAGVYRYAAPVLARAGVSGAVSVCSSFASHQEIFWRYKISYLNSVDGLRFVRSRLGLTARKSVLSQTLDMFSQKMLEELDAVYQQFTSQNARRDAHRLFMTRSQILELHKAGWVIANHTAHHYPVAESSAHALLNAEFEECDSWLQSELGIVCPFWVIPFDRLGRRCSDLSQSIGSVRDRTFVFVGNEVNRSFSTTVSRIGVSRDTRDICRVLVAAGNSSA